MIGSIFILLFAAADAEDASAWLTLAEAKAHCRVTDSTEDALIDHLIATVARVVERESWRFTSRASREFSFQGFGCHPRDRVIIPALPVVAIEAVTYLDANGAEQTLTPADYRLGNWHGLASLQPSPGTSWPATAALDGAVTVRALCGHVGAEDFPADLKNFALLMLTHYFDNREAVGGGSAASSLSDAAARLLADYRPGLFH
jgi:uncharacterized phiE125 gp8 family phage protein